MFHTQAYWLRTVLLHPRKPFGFRCCVGQGVLTPLPSRRPGEARKAVYQGREGIQELLTRALRAGGYVRDNGRVTRCSSSVYVHGAPASCKDLEVCHYCKQYDLYHAVKSLSNVSQSSILVLHTLGQSSQIGHYRWDVAG